MTPASASMWQPTVCKVGLLLPSVLGAPHKVFGSQICTSAAMFEQCSNAQLYMHGYICVAHIAERAPTSRVGPGRRMSHQRVCTRQAV